MVPPVVARVDVPPAPGPFTASELAPPTPSLTVMLDAPVAVIVAPVPPDPKLIVGELIKIGLAPVICKLVPALKVMDCPAVASRKLVVPPLFAYVPVPATKSLLLKDCTVRELPAALVLTVPLFVTAKTPAAALLTSSVMLPLEAIVVLAVIDTLF